MTIIDIHTHHLDAAHAVIAVSPQQFAPQPGLYYAVGLHPWWLDDATPDQLSLLEQVATHPQVVAIGETGLDGLRGPSLEVQRRWLEHHVRVAINVQKPLVVHMVRTAQPLIDTLRRAMAGRHLDVIVHGMRGNAQVAAMLLKAGFCLSFGQHFNPQALLATPRDRLFIETDDAPITIQQVAKEVAHALGMSHDDVMTLVADNAARVLVGQ